MIYAYLFNIPILHNINVFLNFLFILIYMYIPFLLILYYIPIMFLRI